VLDLACGTGAMVAPAPPARLPDAILFGADLSRPQLRAARLRSPWLPLVPEQRHRPPLPQRCLRLVHWSWLLEHVPRERAVDILREVRRVLAPRAWPG